MAKKSGSFVSVGCRVPMGLELRLFKGFDTQEPVMGGGTRAVTVYREVPGKSVMLKGFATAQGVSPGHQIIGGYGLTHNVDKEFMEEWLKQNAESDLVKNQLVFIRETPSEARKEANNLRDNKSNMERLDPNNLPKGVKTAEEGAAQIGNTDSDSDGEDAGGEE
jgi:hypothetical protein